MEKKAEKEKIKSSKKAINNVVIGVFIFLAFFSGWFLGHQDLKFQKGKIIPQIINNNSSTQSVDFSPFWRAWDLVTKNYDGNLDLKKLVNGAIKGMVNAVGDPYTVYMDPEETKNFETDLSGSISGIGAEVGIKDNRLTIIAPVEDSPAQKIGLRSGDVILSINGDDTAKMSLSEAVAKIRGKEGTSVKLSVKRGNETKDYEIERANITVKSVKSSVRDNIGIIEVSSFDENTAQLMKEATNDLLSKNVKGLILDLRDNPGGLLDSAISVSSEFVKNGVVVIERKQDGSNQEVFKASGNGKLTDGKIPLTVLVNGGSASASEIVAGAIQDTKRGVLIGEKTFGKGSVQQIESLGNSGSLRITIAHWYTPNNRNIDKTGLTPDIEAKTTDQDFSQNKDPQMDKAIEYINSKS
ncbi:MAG: S41 family peptidase [Patescibacteria group bacterium]|nr:S41 family peptidase [Patescibacteria group bacterium]